MTHPQAQPMSSEYLEYIEGQRAWLAKNKDAVAKAQDEAKDEAMGVIQKMMRMVMTVAADDPPHKSHWIVAQLRQMLVDEGARSTWRLISRYLRAEQEVHSADRRLALLQTADEASP